MKIIFTLITFLFLTVVQSQDIETIGQIQVEQNIIFIGQILDKGSNEPIPFATIILKKEEIYRVANENGFYELPVEKKMIQNASVTISSIGFESKTILLNKLYDKTFLESKFEELAEVVITGYLSPTRVLETAIAKKALNFPVEPFNFYNYSKLLINKNDDTELDLEYITKEYDGSYLSLNGANERVEQIKWNKNNDPKRFETTTQLESFRYNAIRYASILHKRKFKKFNLNFVKSNNPLDEGLYIIAFKTERNNSNNTGRPYPTSYSGRVYIDRKNFSIIKVIENRETTLKGDEIMEYNTISRSNKNVIQQTIKEESICYYSNGIGNDRYYVTKYFHRVYNEIIDNKNDKKHEVREKNSYLFDFELKDLEEIEYYQYNNKKDNSLFRVEYDKAFWDSFYKRPIGGKSE